MFGSGQLVLGQEMSCQVFPDSTIIPSLMPANSQFLNRAQEDECIVYIKVNMIFKSKTGYLSPINGNNYAYFETGNDGSNPDLPAYYNAHNFAQDLINRLNKDLEYNAPMNMCNGWAYYNPAWYNQLYPNASYYNIAYSPSNLDLTPDATEIKFRFYLTGIRYGNTTNIPGEIELSLQPGGGLGTGWADGVGGNNGTISGIKGIRGDNEWAVSLSMHELGHILGLWHTFQDFICPGSADCSASACSYYVNGDVCGGAINNGCAVYPTSTNNTGNDNVDDTPIDHRCGGGVGITSAPWTMSYCDAPEEIANNYMTYRTIAIPGGFTAGQQNVILAHASNFAMTPHLQETTVFSETFGSGGSDSPPCSLPTAWSTGNPPKILPQVPADTVPQDGNIPFTAFGLSYCTMSFVASATHPIGQGYASLTTPTIDLTVSNFFSAELSFGSNTLNTSASQFQVLIYDVDTDNYIETIYPSTSTTTIDLTPYVGKHIKAVFCLYNDDDNVGVTIEWVNAKIHQTLPIDLTQVPIVSTNCVSTTGVKLSWTSPLYTNQYILSYKELSASNWTTITVNSLSNPNLYQLTDLLPNTTYQVKVQSVYNFCGTDITNQQSNSSSIVTFTTLANNPIITTTNFCINTNPTLSVPLGYSNTQWSTGALGNSITPSTAGTYSVVTTNTNGNCVYSQVVVYPPPTPIINETTPLLGCSNVGITVNLSPTTYSSYHWQQASITTNTSTFYTNASGTIYVTVTDANACTATDQANVTINSPPLLQGNAIS